MSLSSITTARLVKGGAEQLPAAPNSDTSCAYKVLIVSASMGAGHDGAARELAARLEARGHDARIHDFLAAFPIGMGWFFRWLYGRMLALAPWTYDALYKVFPSVYRPFTFAEHHVTGKRLKRWMRDYKPDVIVSTYPLMSLALGRMRLNGKLDIPVITYITDFHVHPMVTHEGVDLHLAVHDLSKSDAMKRVTGAVRRCAPLVSSRFYDAPDRRDEVREALAIRDDQTMVLVVAGSWGAGEVESTVLDLADLPDIVPVVVCGRNEELVERLRAHRGVRALGWTKEMPSLMSAADVLVDNAGGLTAMEALAAGLPIVNYRPLAGHGRDNATDMATAGVVTVAHTQEEFVAALRELGSETERRHLQIENGRHMFGVDATDDVLAFAADRTAPLADVIPLLEQPPKKRKRLRRVAATVGAVALTISLGLTTGVGEAAAHGIGSDRGAANDATYVGIRVTGDELDDPQTQQIIKSLPVTLIVDSGTAATHESELRTLVADGVEIANGGSGQHDPGWTPWSRARLDVQTATTQLNESAGVNTDLFVPGRRIDCFDLLFGHRMHMHALPTAKRVKPGEESEDLSEHGIFVIDGRDQSVTDFRDRLLVAQTTLTSKGAQVEPLANAI